MITRVRRARRTFVVAALIASGVLSGSVPAAARSELQTYRSEKKRLTTTLIEINRTHHARTRALRGVVRRSNEVLRQGPGRGAIANPHRWKHLERRMRHDRWMATMRRHRLDRFTRRRTKSLSARRTEINAWIETWAVLRTCPIRGPHSVSDNYGITVRLPDVPGHKHMGNDISAAMGTPIVAPFDGYATASTGVLGGLEVRVHGEDGYVYNAHLSSYGTLGQVRAGQVIGHVGDTGDATAPHDHFEWHPDDGPAVDPYPFLSVSCG